jgi:hypothetical protein
MTTKVTVTTHDWPVEVMEFPLRDRFPVEGGEWRKIGALGKNMSGEFTVHSGRDLMIRELPADFEEKHA